MVSRMDDKKDVIVILKEENELLFSQLSYADNKINFILVGAVLAVISSIGWIVEIIIGGFQCWPAWKWYLFGYLIWVLLGGIVSSIFCLSGIKPNTDKAEGNGRTNIYFFGDIAKEAKGEDLICDINSRKTELDLANENISLSKIVTGKYKICKCGSSSFISAIFPPYVLWIFISFICQKCKSKKPN